MTDNSFIPSITPEELEKLPLEAFKGDIIVVEAPGIEYYKAIQYLRKQKILGFDTETRPVFEPHHPHRGVALLQLSGPDKAYLFRVCKMGLRRRLRYILSDPGAYNVTYEMFGQRIPMSPDEHFANLKRIIAAMSGKAKRITVIMPMLYEARQHRRASRESLDCAMALQELVAMGVSNIITFDAHDPRVQNAIPNAGFESVMPSYQIFKALLRNNKTLRIDREHMMIVSPDEGAIDRNIFYASVLGLDMGLFYKRRDYTRVVNGRNPIVAHEYLGDSVEGKDVFVADDMISSGESIIDLAKELKKRKANRIFAGCTFALFTNGLESYEKAYRDGLIDRVISTNLTYRNPALKKTEWFVEADMSKYISYIIATLNHDRSLSLLLNPYDRIHALIKRYNNEQKDAGIRLV